MSTGKIILLVVCLNIGSVLLGGGLLLALAWWHDRWRRRGCTNHKPE